MRPGDRITADWRQLMATLACTTDLQSTFDLIAAEVSRILCTPSCVVARDGGGWRILAQARGGLPLAVADLPALLDAVSTDGAVASFDLWPSGFGRWTHLPIGATISLLVAGDRSDLEMLAATFRFAVAAASEREQRTAAMRLVADSYAIVRRASQPEGIDAVAQRIVNRVARSLHADRVALAVYRPEEDCLDVVATCGDAADRVKHARIGAGEWVMGHVYASRRPIVVSDVRKLRRASTGRERYRTFSFAVVPVIAGRTALGVLSATDKKDGSNFNRRDASTLRTFSGVAGLALAAARTHADNRRLARAASTDSLTGLFNRPYFDARLLEEVERSKRAGGSLTLVMADIDDFKSINDRYGHPVGDEVLRAVGHVVRSSVRVFDVCARYGGDELTILMPTSDHRSAVESAERIRARLVDYCSRDARLHKLLPLTISAGVAVLDPVDTPADIVRRADEALYRAKGAGKDAVHVIATRRLPASGLGNHPWPSSCDD